MIFLIIAALILIAIDLVLLWHLLTGAPYVPTRPEGVAKILNCCEVRPGMKAADIGSGDGRILIALARAGAEAHGYEINPLLVWWSRRKIREAGLEGKAFVYRQNLWRTDFSSYEVVTLFGITHIMWHLERKLRRELKPGARAVSISFSFPSWPLKEKRDGIFIYQQP